MIADSIKIETDEDGFHLIVEAPEEDGAFFKQRRFDFRIDDPEALYDAVKAEIGPWLYERDAAQRTFVAQGGYARGFHESGGYATDDPKHPDFHSVHADLWDAREGK